MSDQLVCFLLLQKSNKTDGSRTYTLQHHCFPDEESGNSSNFIYALIYWGHHQSQYCYPQQTHCWMLPSPSAPFQPSHSPSVSLVHVGSQTPGFRLPKQYRSHTMLIHTVRQKRRFSQSGIFSAWATTPRRSWAPFLHCGVSSVQKAKAIFYLDRGFTHSDSSLHFPKALVALINFRRESSDLFLFLREHMSPRDWPGPCKKLVPGCGHCISISRLQEAIPRGEKGCGLARAVRWRIIWGPGAILSERICPDYISQRPRGGIGPPLHSPAGPSASGEGEGQGERPRSWGLDQVPEVHLLGSEETV